MSPEKNKIIILLLLMLIHAADLRAQQFELGLKLLPGLVHTGGLEAGMNGMALEGGYLHHLGSQGLIRGSLEAGYTGWGSQALLGTGFRTGGKHALEAVLLNGMAFYRQGPAWIGGLQASWAGSFFQGEKNALLVSVGMRFSMQPRYRESGALWYYLDLPVTVSWIRH